MKQRFFFVMVVFAAAASAAVAAQVPDTGQTKCYGMTGAIFCPEPGDPLYGQDAQHLTAQRSFIRLDSQGRELPDTASSWSMVRDTVTGLVWELKDSKDGIADYDNPHDADNRYSWHDDTASRNGGDSVMPDDATDTSDFIEALNSRSFGGSTGWRLPTAQELIWLLDRGTEGPPYITAAYFPVAAAEYWTSTTDPSGSSHCATVTLTIGMMNYPDKTDSYAAMAVRGANSLQQFHDNGDGTVSDLTTGLTWQQDSVQGIPWKDALAYCRDLNLGGYSDWRLPDVNELISLVDYSHSSPSIDEQYFTTTSTHYWSSTTYPSDPGKAYHVCFLRGRTEVYGKSDKGAASHVRAVRGIVSDASSTTTTVPNSMCPVEKLYGEHAPQTRLLRKFRDEVLASTGAGRMFINFYYRISPMMDRYISSESSKRAVRAACNSMIAAFGKTVY
jgi:hypothetical protein